MNMPALKTDLLPSVNPLFASIEQAQNQLDGIISATPLALNVNLSDEFQATILLKREDLQVVRSYKIRGAYNKISSLSDAERQHGIVCASAGNHAQGVAYHARRLGIPATIVMPRATPFVKVENTRREPQR